ncbi:MULTISPECIES: hypothetical protein [unclassified Burkholderia]|uniref:hypothetical protein n=1 Tax=unclassified Burkholderia TaxID=2613784 RepID=UPI0014224EE7|nr:MULTISPECIES: hypothetical protein [unclassified Burkholderia]NIE55145.1 hypothetical protein [Burkholderia sp. Ap-955]NIG06402.1 hypothetical protein [Burkholderia sp. Tr-849]
MDIRSRLMIDITSIARRQIRSNKQNSGISALCHRQSNRGFSYFIREGCRLQSFNRELTFRFLIDNLVKPLVCERHVLRPNQCSDCSVVSLQQKHTRDAAMHVVFAPAHSRRPCDQSSRNIPIPHDSSLFSPSPIAHPNHVAYGAARPRAIQRPTRALPPGPSTVVPHDGRAGRARRSPSPRCRPSAPRIHEERDVIHKVLILFALCIAGLAAIAAGFQHIPS